MRLNQALAKTGICSRRQADELIAQGRVSINGSIVRDFSSQIDPDRDSLCLDGKMLVFKRNIYVMLNKPKGIVSTRSDESDRQTVLDLLPPSLRHLRPVGRLDMYSEGLLLLTNDGHLAQKVTHPIHHMSKTYLVEVEGEVSDRELKQLSSGISLEDGITQPAKVRLVGRNKTYSEFEIVLKEGRNRQIRRMCDHLGYRVTRLQRLSIGRLQLGDMSIGTWRYLTDVEVRLLHPERPSGN